MSAQPPVGARAALLLAAIGGSILALLLGFSFSLMAASRQFEHALIAQQQAALVDGIARDAGALDARALRDNLAAYRALIARERAYLTRAERQPQRAELARADALFALAGDPAARLRLIAMVQSIAAAEQREVAAARADLYRIRRATITLGILLALTALGATLAGAMQLRRANRDLAREVAERTADLRAIDQSRRLFFAKASHELRTPVTAIRTLAEVALESGGGTAQPLQHIVAQTAFLGHRIEEMLALSSAAEGRPVLAPVPCDLAGVAAAAVAQAQPYAQAIGVAIHHSGEPAPVLADARWLAQALLAIIDNGLKFSDPGAALEVRLARQAQKAAITIADTGPGVLPRDLPRIFDAYYQADAGRSRGGSGLGLALARWVVEQHGGTIHAENRESGGCVMMLSLPLAQGPLTERSAA